MHVNETDDRALVRKCMQQLFAKAGISQQAGPVQRDLDFLCESIEIQTGVSISLSTMKRLYNGQFSKIPQVATLNAISMFLGYPNWYQFKHENSGDEVAAAKINASENHAITTKQKRSFDKIKWMVAGLAVITASFAGFFFYPKKNEIPDFSKALFSAQKTSSNEIPNTVVFKYNVDSVDADSFFIQQSWDRSRRVRVAKHQYTLTDIYYEPGYHTAKLIANDQVIRTMDVSIPTDRWFFYAKEKSPKSIPKYFHPSNETENGSLNLSSETITKGHVDTQKAHEYFATYFPSKIIHSSDNYVLKCRIRVKQLTNHFCPTFTCEVFCQKNFMFFDAMSKSCASEIRVQFGEDFLSGKNHDFSAMGTDVMQWKDIELRVENRKVSIAINNKKVFSTSYKVSSGLITGLGFISNNAFEVDFADFRTLEGNVIYQNDFD